MELKENQALECLKHLSDSIYGPDINPGSDAEGCVEALELVPDYDSILNPI